MTYLWCFWSWGLWSFSLLGSCRSALCVSVELIEVGSHIDGVTLLGEVLSNDTSFWSADVHSDFVGLDTSDDLVGFDVVARVYGFR